MLPLPRTLVVEDDPIAALALQTALRTAGQPACLSFAADGLGAIEYLQGKELASGVASPSLPGLLLLNLRLPIISGFAVLDWLAARPHLRPRVIVAVCPSDRPQDQAWAITYGADLALLKPSDPAGFEGLVARLKLCWCALPPLSAKIEIAPAA
jgi:CheY-like chemotaxis protein